MKNKSACARSSKVASEIKRVVSELLIRGEISSYEGINPAMIVITGVEVSSCLQHAKIFVSSINKNDVDVQSYIDFLELHSPQIRHYIGSNVKLKFVPEIRFILDTSEEQAQRIEDILSSLS